MSITTPTTISSVLKHVLSISTSPASRTLKLGLVSGNQSGDADSIISSIAYCYLHYKHITSSEKSPSVVYLPYLNFNRSELRLRKDVLYVFKQFGITPESLLFSDDLSSKVKDNESLRSILLVDHNIPQGPLANFIAENQGKLTVSGIIDHHVDERKFTEVEPRFIEKAGSCASLVYDYFKNGLNYGDFVSRDQELLNFIINPVLLDTSNMSSRVESFDLALYQDFLNTSVISSQSGHDIDQQDALSNETQDIYGKLIQAKNDITGLTFMDLLNKDYKNFTALADSQFVFGISSVGVPLEYIQATYTFEEVNKDVEDFIKNNGLGFLAVMASFVKPNTDEFHRQLGFFQATGFVRYEDLIQPLKLKDFIFDKTCIQALPDHSNPGSWCTHEQQKTSGFEVKLFQQLEIKSSRKQVAPLLREKVGVHNH